MRILDGARRLALTSTVVLSATLFQIQASADAPAKTIKVTPQTVVDLTLSKGFRAKGAELVAQRSYLALQKALGEFDFQFKLTPQYEYNEAQTISGTQDLVDRITTITTSVSKKVRTGSVFTLDYLNVIQNATLQPTVTTRTPNAALDALQFTYRQSMWRNSFGYADRLALEIGQATIDSALQNRELSLQTIILDSMTLFWNAYIAERQLRENLFAREKYEQLVKTTRQKAGFNLSSPGELPRLEAELQGVEQKVKGSSATYLNSITALLTALQLDIGDAHVELAVPDELPPVPQLKAISVETLRPVRVAKLNLENAQNNLSLVKNQNHPKFDFVAKAKSTGVEENNGDAVAEMQSSSKPYYYLGVEFEMPLDSDLARGLVTDAEVAMKQSENDLKIQTDSVRDQLVSLERSVASQYAVAKSSVETIDLRGRVVKELETAYRQGRQPLVELIRAYNDLFGAQQDRAKAIGQYHILLNQLAAARDELVGAAKK